ncbi:MAG: hypothetical protein GEU93_02445 [Propionibacteriales bacterium]|nr:hypothetical protein [Propionibacteriales bacterium]
MNGPRWSWATRIGNVLVLLVLLLLVPVPAAQAACEGDPVSAARPDGGLVGWFVTKPDDVPPAEARPFADNSKYSVSDVYGWGTHWGTYDLGCGPDAAKAPTAGPFTAFGNLALEVSKFGGVFLSWIGGFVENLPLGWLDAVITDINRAVMDNIWKFWFPLTILAIGIFLLWRARQAAFAETGSAFAWMVVVLVVSVFFLNYPAKAGELFDDGLGQLSSVARKPFGNSTVESLVMEEIIYPTWSAGQFGSADSPTARRYGPELYWSTHYTWAEVEEMRGDPDAAEEIAEEKGETYERIAQEVQDSDPAAYAHFTGNEAQYRLGQAVMSWPFVLFTALFIAFGLALVAIGFLMVRLFVVAFPVIGLIGAHPKGHVHIQGLWDLFAAALWNVVKFNFIVGVYTLAVGALLVVNMNPLGKLFFLVVLTVVCLMIAKPFRALKSMVPGVNPNQSYLAGTMRRAVDYAMHRHAVEEGVAAADRRARPDSPTTTTQPPGRKLPEEETLPPIPVASPGRHAGRPTVPEPYKVDIEWGTPTAPATTPYGAPGLAPGDVPAGRPAPAIGKHRGASEPVRELPAVPAAATDRPFDPTASPAMVPAAATADGRLEPSYDFGVPKPPDAASGPPLRRFAIGEDEAVEPVYQRNPASPQDADVEIPLADTQLDREGNEVFMVYSRADRRL